MLAEDYVPGRRAHQPPCRRSSRSSSVIEKRPTDSHPASCCFPAAAYTMAPLTFDHDWLREAARARAHRHDRGRTAIGDGLGVSLTRLEQAKRRKRRQTPGARSSCCSPTAPTTAAHSPQTATELRKARGIPVTRSARGRTDSCPSPSSTTRAASLATAASPADLDEGALREISNATGGKFFRAFDTDTAESAFKGRSTGAEDRISGEEYLLTTELFNWVAAPGLGVLAPRGAVRATRVAERNVRVRTVKQPHPALSRTPLKGESIHAPAAKVPS